MKSYECQIPCLRQMSQGSAEVPPQSLIRCLKLAIRRRLTPRQERALKARLNNLINWFCRITGTRWAAPIMSRMGASS
jgi:hypothetical protein